MLGQVGMILAAAANLSSAQPNTVTINLVAQVPVTCSSAAVLDTNSTSTGFALRITGACNADHRVRLVVPEQVLQTASARLNGVAGSRSVSAFEFTRRGYFSGQSLVELDFVTGANAPASAPQNLRVEISPL